MPIVLRSEWSSNPETGDKTSFEEH